MSDASAGEQRASCSCPPDRAVIDIGSNTVRLVVYAGSPRAPRTWLNEKVVARLGQDLSTRRRIPENAASQALEALRRYAIILSDLGVSDVQTIATAATRDASNGPEFLERVRSLGFSPRLLSGEEEARGSAFGVIGAFRDARGTVADLGGGSLELVKVEDGDCHDGTSLPLGALGLPALGEPGSRPFRRAIEKKIAKVRWGAAHSGAMYMVGGTWRAMAAFIMRSQNHPLTDSHGFTLDPEQADRAAGEIAKIAPEDLARVPGVSAARALGLPYAAAMLRIMLAELQPDRVVFSCWGLREGVLFQRLERRVRQQDPLLAAVADFAEPRGGSAEEAAAVADWTAAAATGSPRLRLASAMLSLAARHIEPSLRPSHAYDWALHKRWVGLAPEGRAQIAAALLAACGKTEPPKELERLTDRSALGEAVAWGLSLRLCRRLTGGTHGSLAASALSRKGERLVLAVQSERAPLVSERVQGDLKSLARWLDLKPELRIVGA